MPLTVKGHLRKGRLVLTERSRLRLKRFIEKMNEAPYAFITFHDTTDNEGYLKFYFGVLLPALIDQVGEYKLVLDSQLREVFGFGQDIKSYTPEQWKQYIASITNFFEIEI